MPRCVPIFNRKKCICRNSSRGAIQANGNRREIYKRFSGITISINSLNVPITPLLEIVQAVSVQAATPSRGVNKKVREYIGRPHHLVALVVQYRIALVIYERDSCMAVKLRVKQIPERTSDGAILELAAAQDGCTSAERGVSD